MDDLAELLDALESRLPDLTRDDADLPSNSVDLDDEARWLSAAERNLPPDHPLLETVRARLGFLLGTRYLTRAEPPDRAEAIRLLRAAREAGAAAGLGAADTARGTLMLALLLLPVPVPWRDGQLPEFETMVNWSVRQTTSATEIEAGTAEAERLLAELPALGVGRRMVDQTALLARVARQMRSLLGGDLGGMAALAEEVFAEVPDAPHRDQVRGLLDLARSTPPGTPLFPPAGASPASDPDRQAAELLLQADLAVPGTLGVEKLRETVARLQTGQPAATDTDPAADSSGAGTWGKLSLALRTGDSELALQAVEEIHRLARDVPEVEPLLAFVPMVARLIRGNLQDEDAAIRALDENFPKPTARQPATPAAPDGPGRPAGGQARETGAGLDAQAERLGRALRLTERLNRLTRPSTADQPGQRRRHVAALQEIRDELLDLTHGEGERDLWYGLVQIQLSTVECELALCSGNHDGFRAALERLDRLVLPETMPRSLSSMLTILAQTLPSAVGLLGRHPQGVAGLSERLREHLEREPLLVNMRALSRAGVANMLLGAHEQSGDRALLDEAIAELERARDELVEGVHLRAQIDVRWGLARGYAARAEPGDLRRATDAGLDMLRSVAEDVTLQLGAEHALQTARAGASRGLRIVEWALADGLLPEAVRALEAGRSLVLRSAAASAGVPERLEALGRRDLADEWRRAAPPDSDTGAAGTSVATSAETTADAPDDLSAAERLVPSTLRRRALDALGDGATELLAVPDVPELAAGLAASGADALVYLLPGTAVLLGPDAEDAEVLRLPGLTDAADGPVGAYLSAADGARDPARQARWEAALEELCDWAGREVMGPVLGRIRRRRAAGPPRVVLVPCGRLGVVPWHAARLPDAEGGYAVRRAVLSYASSGAQFLAAAGRDRTPPAERPVLVADPRLRLLWAVDEVTTLRRACYADALLYGDLADEPVPVRGVGTPQELLGAFDGAAGRDRASLLHVASHGAAGGRPTVSALDLTGPLTVARILDRPGGGPGAAERGPLVVLSACETDLSTRDHDEALTLTTAFVARGATDAVGSRWVAQDSTSALLMAVFHHRLTAGGLAPPDALRAAQLWMLDPDRTPPPGVTGPLLDEAAGQPLHRVRCWAPFIHQGNPSPRRTQEG